MIINITCPHCNFSKKVPGEKIPEGIKFARCPSCKQTFEINPAINTDVSSPQELTGRTREPEASERSVCVNDEEAGYFTVLWHTFRSALFSPVELFSEKRQEKAIGQSLAFGLLTGSLGTMFGVFWRFILSSQDFSYVLRVLPDSITVNHIFIGYIIISPFLVLILMFITAAIFHFCLYILGGATRGFWGTFKACAYSNAASIFNIIPFIGWLIDMIWGIVIMVIGLREIHETTTFKAVFALLIPFFLLVVFGIVIGLLAAFYLSSQLM